MLPRAGKRSVGFVQVSDENNGRYGLRALASHSSCKSPKYHILTEAACPSLLISVQKKALRKVAEKGLMVGNEKWGLVFRSTIVPLLSKDKVERRGEHGCKATKISHSHFHLSRSTLRTHTRLASLSSVNSLPFGDNTGTITMGDPFIVAQTVRSQISTLQKV